MDMSLDIQTTLGTVLQLLGGACGVWLVTEIVKTSKRVPWINEKQKGRLRGFAGVLSILITVVLGVLNENLRPEDLQGLVIAIVSCMGVFGGATAIHKVNDNGGVEKLSE